MNAQGTSLKLYFGNLDYDPEKETSQLFRDLRISGTLNEPLIFAIFQNNTRAINFDERIFEKK